MDFPQFGFLGIVVFWEAPLGQNIDAGPHHIDFDPFESQSCDCFLGRGFRFQNQIRLLFGTSDCFLEPSECFLERFQKQIRLLIRTSDCFLEPSDCFLGHGSKRQSLIKHLIYDCFLERVFPEPADVTSFLFLQQFH